MSDLKPCPFCAREIQLKRHVTEFLDVYMVPDCPNCGSFEDLDLLEDDWNTRPIETALQSQIDRLTKERDELKQEIMRLNNGNN